MNTVQSFLASFYDIAAPSKSEDKFKFEEVATVLEEGTHETMVQALMEWNKWKRETTPIDSMEIERFCLQFLINIRQPTKHGVWGLCGNWILEYNENEVYRKLDYSEYFIETKFSNDDIEQFCFEVMAAKALGAFALNVARGFSYDRISYSTDHTRHSFADFSLDEAVPAVLNH